jgi:hypothetical protein
MQPPEREALFEALAAAEHERWSHWQAYVHRLYKQPDGSVIIPAGHVAAWERQIATPYMALTEQEKASDREQVQRYWHLIEPLTRWSWAKRMPDDWQWVGEDGALYTRYRATGVHRDQWEYVYAVYPPRTDPEARYAYYYRFVLNGIRMAGWDEMAARQALSEAHQTFLDLLANRNDDELREITPYHLIPRDVLTKMRLPEGWYEDAKDTGGDCGDDGVAPDAGASATAS